VERRKKKEERIRWREQSGKWIVERGECSEGYRVL
jgi:hypothetical protein